MFTVFASRYYPVLLPNEKHLGNHTGAQMLEITLTVWGCVPSVYFWHTFPMCFPGTSLFYKESSFDSLHTKERINNLQFVKKSVYAKKNSYRDCCFQSVLQNTLAFTARRLIMASSLLSGQLAYQDRSSLLKKCRTSSNTTSRGPQKWGSLKSFCNIFCSSFIAHLRGTRHPLSLCWLCDTLETVSYTHLTLPTKA